MNLWTTLQGTAHQLAQVQSRYVVAALALYIFSVIVSASRWRVILSTLGCRVGLTGTLVPYLCGVAVGNLTPARMLGADACRLAVLGVRHGTPTRVAAASVFYDRLSEIPAVVVLALVATPAVWVLVSRSNRYLLVAAFVVVAISGILYGSTIRRRVSSWLSSWHDRLVGTPIDPAGLGVAVGLSGLVWLQDVVRLMLVSAAFRVSLTPSQAATLAVLTIVGGIVPTVGGLGVVESGLVGGLALFGVPVHVAVAITAAERAVSYGFGTCAGALTLVMVGGRRVWTAACQGRARLAAPASVLLLVLAAWPAAALGEGPKPAGLAPTLTRIEAALRADPGNLQVGARYRLLAIQNHEPRQTYHVRTFITLEDLIEATLDANKRQDTSLGELLGKESQEE